MDPNDPDFLSPYVEFIQTPEEGATLDICYVRFEWEGNQPSMKFSYQLDNNEWSDWSTEKSIEFDYLDEGDHTFQIKSQYFNSVESETPQEISFVVDDVQGPALIFYPRKVEVMNGSNFSVEITTEEVTNLAGIKAVVDFDPNYLMVCEIQVYDNEDAFLKKNGGTLISFSEYDNTSGYLKIESGIATANPAGVEGSGTLARITFKAKQSGSTEMFFDEYSEMRNPDNENIVISEVVKGIVIIE